MFTYILRFYMYFKKLLQEIVISDVKPDFLIFSNFYSDFS